MADRSAVVIGVGPPRGLGAAIARRFAREGFRVTMMGRSAEKLRASTDDLRAARRRRRGRRRRRHRRGAGARRGHARGSSRTRRSRRRSSTPAATGRGRSATWTREFLEEMWRVNALAGLFFAKAALDVMLPRKRGVADLHRCVGVASRAGDVRRLRLRRRRRCGRSRSRRRASSVRRASMSRTSSSTARSTATASTPSFRGSRPSAVPTACSIPDAIAENYWCLHCQPRSAWTHELDLRPWVETW